MVYCGAPGCTNSTNKTVNNDKKIMKNGKKSFFSFPDRVKEPRRYKTWVARVRRAGWKPSKYARLCEDHFDPSCFLHNPTVVRSVGYVLGRKYLQADAEPTIFGKKTSAASQLKERNSRVLMKRKKIENKDKSMQVQINLKKHRTYSRDTQVRDMGISSQKWKSSPRKKEKLLYEDIDTLPDYAKREDTFDEYSVQNIMDMIKSEDTSDNEYSAQNNIGIIKSEDTSDNDYSAQNIIGIIKSEDTSDDDYSAQNNIGIIKSEDTSDDDYSAQNIIGIIKSEDTSDNDYSAQHNIDIVQRKDTTVEHSARNVEVEIKCRTKDNILTFKNTRSCVKKSNPKTDHESKSNFTHSQSFENTLGRLRNLTHDGLGPDEKIFVENDMDF